MNKLFTQLLEKRQIQDDFLYPKYENLTPALAMPDITPAITRLEQAIKNHERILIYGDYDVDGVTASALMENALRLSGISPDQISIMLPDRFIDGYGMSPRLVDRAKSTGANLVLTVDCGSRNHDIVAALSENHIDTIITDHHECADTLPGAVAIINPKRHDFTGPATLKDLAGVGVAFKLATALMDAGHIKKGQEKWLLDLVLLGTICDSMLLTGENRILGYYGIKVLEKTRRPGLRELMKNAGVTKITSETIGFQLGPRLNAAGRLDTAELALNLLRTDSAATAAAIAAELEELNNKRRTEQRAATEDIKKRRASGSDDQPVIVEAGNWHEGVLGIIAGRLVESYHRPAFVLSEVEDGILKGSGRSFGDFSLAEALSHVGDTIIGGGGHAAAAGVRLHKDKLADFEAGLNSYYQSLHLDNQERFLREHSDLTMHGLQDFTLDLLSDLRLLEPYGPGNKAPILRLTGAQIVDVKRMGKDGSHLRLDLKSQDNKTIKSIAFSAPAQWFDLYPEENYDFLIRPVENEWNGVRSIEARLVDVLPAAADF